VARRIHLRGHAIAIAALALLGALGITSAQSSQAMAASCAHADDTHATASLGQLEKSVVCLINHKRDDRGKHHLDRNGKLNEASARHTKTMLKKDCFKDRCPGEPGLGGRIRDSGYLRGAHRWHYAENTGCGLTPQDMYHAWFASPFNRKNILKAKYRDVGAGAGKGVPQGHCGNDAALTTYTVVFAWREP
jgi:uncharacterized protein YkwD